MNIKYDELSNIARGVAAALREKGFRRAQDFSYATTAKEMVAIYESIR